ncbi:MAG: exodeoxyribonuclease VII small subunit [Clostridiales bacterium]|nr:exodeoxyribonuclease VII small subunit [Clostridiales bacterium]MDO4349004.1 exodeoxyribonuclease VII small subunit [Eubacteriales bacterium]MDY4009767.1 exodeoxyribonuclease VII small subunit [Candidatus Limiplasma sp.]
MAGKAAKKAPAFEEGLARLEAIAEQMEGGSLPMEELLKLYEEGMGLSEALAHKLDEAQSRMREVQANAKGEPVVVETDVVRQESLLDGLEP